jgi:hypothetical protein
VKAALLALMTVVESLGQPAAPAPPAYEIESLRVRYTYFSQMGYGYQSAAGPAGLPGSEWLTVHQPQAEIIARLGERVTQRIWLPVDVVTAASPDHSRYGKPYDAPVDAVTTASRGTLTGQLDVLTRYRWDRATDVYFRTAFHIEEPFESWIMGMGATRSLAEDNTVLGVSVNQVLDWFDRFDLKGDRHGRAARSSTNLNLDVTQVLSPTTIANLSYGGTVQRGTLSNTWQSVNLTDGMRGEERVPNERLRHSLSARVAQWLPWQGALTASYRAYLDSWGIAAHSTEGRLTQRLYRGLYLRANYRYHWQNQPGFFTIAADPAGTGYRTSDSDLGRFHAQTFGGAASFGVPLLLGLRDVHVDFGYERYLRSDELKIHVTTCALGFRY